MENKTKTSVICLVTTCALLTVLFEGQRVPKKPDRIIDRVVRDVDPGIDEDYYDTQIQPPKIAFDANADCIDVLHKGRWEQVVCDACDNKLSGNKTIQWSGPLSCDYKSYTAQSALSCLKKFQNIHIYGDSRSRQIGSAIKSILFPDITFTTMKEHQYESDPFYYFDSAKEFPKNNVIQTDTLKVRQHWINHYDQFSKVLSQIKYEKPEVIIITALILHPLTMTGFENKNNITADYIKSNADTADATAKKAIPILLETALRQNSKILVFEAEPLQPEVQKYDPLRNILIDRHNEVLKELIPDEGLQNTIFRVSMNLNTVHLDGNYMLPDRIHLMKKDVPRKTPPPMLANLNTVFNFLCNRFDRNQDLCCQNNDKMVL